MFFAISVITFPEAEQRPLIIAEQPVVPVDLRQFVKIKEEVTHLVGKPVTQRFQPSMHDLSGKHG